VNRLWVVRSVALLLVVVGLQAGSFRGFDNSRQWVHGADEGAATVLAEVRKPHAKPAPPSAAASPPRPARGDSSVALTLTERSRGSARAASRHHVPDPTGPPRA